MNSFEGYSLNELAVVTKAQVHGPKGISSKCEHLIIDSRKPLPSSGALFVALRGARHNGHDHIMDMHQRGVRIFLVDTAIKEAPEDSWSLEVPDTLLALQAIAAFHRLRYDLNMIAITGSNGKTVVKEWLYRSLQGNEQVVRSPGSWNSQVGVPLSLWNIRQEHTVGLFEAGISQPGEMDRLREMITPSIGVFTNIGPAHGENFSDNKSKAKEKALLFNGCKGVVLCMDHGEVLDAVKALKGPKIIGWSRQDESAFVFLESENIVGHNTVLALRSDGRHATVELPFTDGASIENGLHCITTLLHLGFDFDLISERMLQVEPVSMRMQVLEGISGSTLLNDAYSNDLASLRIALEQLQAISSGRRKVAILSDIEQSATRASAIINSMLKSSLQAGVEHVHGIGAHWSEHATDHKNVTTYADTNTFLAHFDTLTIRNSAVLIKGARSFGLERAVYRLERKAHSTVLEIDLSAIRHNLNYHRSFLEPGTRIMAMVKAFGYGGGSPELARMLEFERVDQLGVAYVDEGVLLREEGIKTPIMVMNPEGAPWDVLARYDLEPEVFSINQLEQAISYGNASGMRPRIHLKMDTGMHRLGITDEQLPQVIQLLQTNNSVEIASLFSHLAGSEDAALDDRTRQQFDAFNGMANAIGSVIDERPVRHILNSAGIRRFPEMQLDMVRIGIGLFGVGGGAIAQNSMRPACTLHSIISQIKTVDKGDRVGYGNAFIANHPTRVAIVPLGYADGLSRSLGKGNGKLYINDQPAPTVGNICMDMCMVDVTNINCVEGDLVEVFGPKHPMEDLAQAMNTIPYEVLATISQRVKRVYVQE